MTVATECQLSGKFPPVANKEPFHYGKSFKGEIIPTFVTRGDVLHLHAGRTVEPSHHVQTSAASERTRGLAAVAGVALREQVSGAAAVDAVLIADGDGRKEQLGRRVNLDCRVPIASLLLVL